MPNANNSDMVDRIKQRLTRAVVPERDTSFADLSVDLPSTSSAVPPLSPERQELEQKLNSLPKISDRRNIRLEVGIEKELDGLNVTIETFLEAAYLACKRDDRLMASVLAEASQRLASRKQAGKLRRLNSQLRQL